jgi:hypothetical protein
MTEQIEKRVTISDDGTAMFDGFIPMELCDDYIKYFDDRDKAGFTSDRWTSQNQKSTVMEDAQLFLSNGDFLTDVDAMIISQRFLKIFWEEMYAAYVKKFSVLTTHAPHKIYNLKIQKTEPSQGYHVWHCENNTREYATRILVIILYLNDVEEGGETEFLYAKKRVQAKKGRVLLWPAGFPHTHRGNPPLSGEKYIMTGWVEF